MVNITRSTQIADRIRNQMNFLQIAVVQIFTFEQKEEKNNNKLQVNRHVTTLKAKKNSRKEIANVE